MFTTSRRTKSLVIVLLLALMILIPTTSYAQGGGNGDKVVFGNNYTLAAGEILQGDLAVFGGTVDIQTGATVQGDVSVIGGTANIDGHIRGDVVAVGGVVHLNAHAVVDGDATAVGGVINRSPGAQVSGNIIGTEGRSEDTEIDGTPAVPPIIDQIPGPIRPHRPSPKSTSWFVTSLLNGLSAITWTAILVALGVLLILMAPAATERVANAMHHSLLLSFGVGIAAVILTIPLIILLSITICLIPVALIIPFILLGTLLLGWLALGWLLGKAMLKAANTQSSTPIWEMIVGVAILTMLWKLPTILPFVGGFASWLVMFIAGNIALGGALLTRFGTRAYPAEPTQAPAPVPEAALAATSTVPTAAQDEAQKEPQQPIIPPPPPAPETPEED